MSKESKSKVEEIEKVTETVKEKGDDLRKQVANIAFTVRKIKDWMEEKMGADIDGDGRVGSGPYKKISAFLCIIGLSAFCVFADSKTNIANWGGTEATPWTYIDQSGNIVAPSITVGNFTVNTNVTISGNATVAGAITGSSAKVTGSLVVGNGLTVDTNASIGGTLSVTGVATFVATPICKNGITVGTNGVFGGAVTAASMRVNGQLSLANGEYFINDQDTYMKCSGHLVSVGDGTFNLGSSTQQFGYLYLANDAAIGGTVDADKYTADAGAGIDVQSAGLLAIGTNTATSINYGGAVVTAHTFVTDGTGTGEIVLPSESIGNAELASGIDAAKLLAASVASAIDISAATNANASELKSGTIPNARIVNLPASSLQAASVVSAIDGSAITNIPNAGITSLSAAKLTAGSSASAINGNAVTNLNGGNFGSSMTAANLTAGSACSAINGAAITNLTGTASPNGTVLNALDISACTNLPEAGVVLGTNLGKLTLNNGTSLTNMTAATAFPGYAVCVVTNLDANGTTNVITFIGTVSYP